MAVGNTKKNSCVFLFGTVSPDSKAKEKRSNGTNREEAGLGQRRNDIQRAQLHFRHPRNSIKSSLHLGRLDPLYWIRTFASGGGLYPGVWSISLPARGNRNVYNVRTDIHLFYSEFIGQKSRAYDRLAVELYFRRQSPRHLFSRLASPAGPRERNIRAAMRHRDKLINGTKKISLAGYDLEITRCVLRRHDFRQHSSIVVFFVFVY